MEESEGVNEGVRSKEIGADNSEREGCKPKPEESNPKLPIGLMGLIGLIGLIGLMGLIAFKEFNGFKGLIGLTASGTRGLIGFIDNEEPRDNEGANGSAKISFNGNEEGKTCCFAEVVIEMGIGKALEETAGRLFEEVDAVEEGNLPKISSGSKSCLEEVLVALFVVELVLLFINGLLPPTSGLLFNGL